MVATRAAQEAQFSVALVEQPYRVAGRKSQPPAAQLDASWMAVMDRLRSRGAGRPAADPRRALGRRARRLPDRRRDERRGRSVPRVSRASPRASPRRRALDELEAVTVPVLVVQGESDPFGMPGPAPNRTVVTVAGNHSLKADPEAVGGAVRDWLSGCPFRTGITHVTKWSPILRCHGRGVQGARGPDSPEPARRALQGGRADADRAGGAAADDALRRHEAPQGAGAGRAS